MSRADLFTKLLGMNDAPARVVAGYYYHTQPFTAGTTRRWRTAVTSAPSALFRMRKYSIYIFETNERFAFKQGTYYKPKAKDFRSVDVIIAVTNTHVILVQASVADDHSFKEEVLKWVSEHGAITVEYVYLSPPTTKSVSIPFPASIPEDLTLNLKYFSDPEQIPPLIIPPAANSLGPQSGPYSVQELPVLFLGIYHVHMKP
ncbi:hypothetical protein GYMLUDRAFT_47309, partial [Collybiopsis luxurians FD-317 M1]